jgi:hypothetical protein
VGGYLLVGVEGAKIGEILVWFWCLFHTNIGTTSADPLRYKYGIGDYLSNTDLEVLKIFFMRIKFLPTIYWLFLVVIFTYCSNEPSSVQESNQCKFQKLNFSILLPCGAKHENLNSVDSEAGKFIWNGYSLIYDRMNTGFDVKCITDSVYLVEKRWVFEAMNILPLKQDVAYNVNSIAEKIQILDLNIPTRKVIFQYENRRYNYLVNIPTEILNTEYFQDSIRGEQVLFKIERNSDLKHFNIEMFTSIKKHEDIYNTYHCKGTTFSIRNVSQDDSLSVMELLKSVSVGK